MQEGYSDELVKEVYAHFGLAMYLAQCLEHSLVNALCCFDLMPNKKTWQTKSDFDLFMDKNFETTMGKMISNFKRVTQIPSDLSDLLSEAKDNRNFLAHNYFREHAAEFVTVDGCNKMIVELQSIQMFFDKVEEVLEKLAAPIRKKYTIE
jgi:hypothetical protein